MNEWVLPSGVLAGPAAYMIVAFLALMLTGISKGGFGGVGTLSIPMMMAVAPADFSLGVWLPLLVFCDIVTLRYYPREWQLRPVLVLAPSMVLGLFLGWLLLGRISPRAIKLFVGATSLAFVALDQVRAWLKWRLEHPKKLTPFRPTWLTATPFGVGAGITTMIAHAAGAITTIYFLPQRMNPRDFVGTQARFFFVFNAMKLPFYLTTAQPLINHETLRKSVWMVPLAPLGVWVGVALNRRLSPAVFNQVVYILLAVSGMYLIYENWWAVGSRQ